MFVVTVLFGVNRLCVVTLLFAMSRLAPRRGAKRSHPKVPLLQSAMVLYMPGE